MKGAVILDIAKGRRLLGYEVGFVAVAGTAPVSPTIAIVLNNDADFVAKRITLVQFGNAGCEVVLPRSVTAQVRDSATGMVFFRQSGSFASFGSVPAINGAANGAGYNPRFVMNKEGLPAPYLMRRGSSAFIEISNPAAYSFTGDLYAILEGFYVYPSANGEDNDPVPNQIKGYCLPFSWNGSLVVATAATAGVRKLGTIEMLGPGVGHFILKTGAISSTAGNPAAVNSGVLKADDVLALNIYDTREQSKRWQHLTTVPAAGQFMPASALTCGGISAPWAHPRYMGGTDKIFCDVYGDGTAWTGNAPGTLELQLNGVWVPS